MLVGRSIALLKSWLLVEHSHLGCGAGGRLACRIATKQRPGKMPDRPTGWEACATPRCRGWCFSTELRGINMLMECYQAMATRPMRLAWGKVAQQSVAAERSPAANRPAQVKRGQLTAEAPASRLDQPALAFAAPVWERSIPSPDRLGCEQPLCSCRSSRRS